jgi:hypothetical protein
MLFKENMRTRRFCVWVVTWPWFRHVSLAVIIANSIVMGLQDPTPVPGTGRPDPTAWRNRLQTDTEPYFTALFTTELCVLRALCGVWQCARCVRKFVHVCVPLR